MLKLLIAALAVYIIYYVWKIKDECAEIKKQEEARRRHYEEKKRNQSKQNNHVKVN